MAQFHAVLLDETGCEFGVSLDAYSRSEAYAQLEEDYPESEVVQLEDKADREAREDFAYFRANRAYEDDGYYDE